MFISEICIQNFRCFKEETVIHFNEGLNVLIGHNNAGKSSLLKALAIIFDSNSSKKLRIDDFNRNIPVEELKKAPPIIQITAKLQESVQEDDYSDDIVTVATWLTKLDRPYEARITFIFSLPEKESSDYKEVMSKLTSQDPDDYWYEIERNFLRKYSQKLYIGDPSNRVTVDPETLKKFDFQFLDAIRDVERDLYSGKNTLLKEVIDYFIDYDIKNDPKLTIEEQHKSLSERRDAFSEDTAKIMKDLQQRLAIGKQEMLQYAESTGATFDGSKPNFAGRILDTDFYSALKLVIESNTGIKIPADQNGLGYNNLIYISLLLAKMQKDASGKYWGSNAKVYPILAIEEPEAHLHPSMQYKFLKFLRQNKQSHVRQIFITTHSPNITAAIKLDDIIVLNKRDGKISPSYPSKVFTTDDPNNAASKSYVERFLDVTKSDMLFAKNIILVEGIAEQLLLPVFANLNDIDLTDCHIAIINIGGRYFDHFLKLFDVQKNPYAIDKKVACITDLDPQYKKIAEDTNTETEEGDETKQSWKSCYPFQLDIDSGYEYKACSNTLLGKFETESNIKIFSQKAKEGCTLEYEIIKNNYTLQGLITSSVSNAPELTKMMSESSFQEACKCLRKGSSENQKIQDALNKIDWPEIEKLKHLIAARYLNSISKGQASQELAQLLSDSENVDIQEKFTVPNYLTEAITWICK